MISVLLFSAMLISGAALGVAAAYLLIYIFGGRW